MNNDTKELISIINELNIGGTFLDELIEEVEAEEADNDTQEAA